MAKFKKLTVKRTKKTVKHPTLLKVGKSGVKAGKIVVITGARANIEVKRRTAEAIINNAPGSTSFNNSTENNPAAQSAEIYSSGTRIISEAAVRGPRIVVKTVKQTKRTIKQTQHHIRAAKNSEMAVKSSTKQIKAAIQNYKKAQHINSVLRKNGEKVTKEAAKNVTKLAAKTIKEIVIAVKNTVQAIAGLIATFGWAALLVIFAVIVIVCILFVISSAFGIFIPDDSSTLTMSEAVARVNTEYQDRVNQLIDEYDNSDIDLIQYTGSRAQWKYVIALYAVKYSSEDGNVMTIDEDMVTKLSKVFFDMHEITASYSQTDSGYGTIWNVLTITTTAKSMAEMMEMYHFSADERAEAAEILGGETDDMWTSILYGFDGANGGYALVEVARGQIGNAGGQLYWSWYGYDGDSAPQDWSGCFVSWCANEAGYIPQGVFPQFSNCMTGIDWFKNKGMWQQPNSSPNVGDIIFVDYNNDGIADRCGIVSGIINNMAKVITANSDTVVETAFNLDNSYGWIMGYGILPQISGLIGDTVEEQCYNYLRAEGYSEIAACAVIANFHGECSCDPGIYSHDYGDAAGIMQWTGPNKNIFFSWCSNNAMDWRNLESQLYFYSYWLNDVNNGEWSRISGSRHPDFRHVYSTEEFKQISADDYNGDIARALYEATAMFVDDMERPYDTWGGETRRYTYAVQFYNYLVAGGVDGTTQAAWRPEYANDIGVFHLN